MLLVADWCLQELVVGPRHSFGFVLLSFPASRKYGPMSGVFWDTFISFTACRTGSARAFVSGHEHPSRLGSKSSGFAILKKKTNPPHLESGFSPSSLLSPRAFPNEHRRQWARVEEAKCYAAVVLNYIRCYRHPASTLEQKAANRGK